VARINQSTRQSGEEGGFFMSVFETVPPSPSQEGQSWSTEFGEQFYEAEAPWGGEAGPALESPFATASLAGGATATVPTAMTPPIGLESPFRLGFTATSEADRETEAFSDLLAEFHDEQFDEAVAQLVDEAAGLHLRSGASWSSSEAAPAMATAELEAWIQPLQYEADRMFENMAERLSGEDLDAMREPELEALLESLRPDRGMLPEAFENFLGGAFNFAKKLVKGAVKGISAVGSAIGKVASLPVKFLLKKLGALVRPLLQKVLQSAIGLLPAPVQPLARTLASRFVGETEAEAAVGDHEVGPELGQEFQAQAAALLLAPDEAEADAIVAEAEAQATQPGSAAVLDLDHARAQLAQQLTSLPPGHEPVAELEQFIPVVMAAQQLIRWGIRLIGREKVVGFLARAIAGLLKGMVGQNAAVALGRPIASAGLQLLGLEAPPLAKTALAGEALASTVEETVRDVLQLPAEAFEDPLRLEAEVQEAFAEAAARNIPAEHLKTDLPQLETAGEGGVWVLMPRAARPRYRYKKYSRVFYVPITRHIAQAIPTRDGGTLETLLADRGVTAWPANVEVHLYEALPGTHLGHIAEFEGESEASPGETLDELQPLTPEAAAMLVHEPRLGRPHLGDGHYHPARAHHPGAHPARLGQPHHPMTAHLPSPHGAMPAHPAAHPGRLTRPLPPGNRYFRLRLPGQARPGSVHPRRRFRVSFERHGNTPIIRVHLHLSEREAQELGELLHRGALPATVTWLKHRYHHVAPAVLTARLLKHGAVLLGKEPTSHQAVRLALHITESLTRALATFVRTRQAELVTAVQNPAQGLTFIFTFHSADPATLASGRVPMPHVGVRAGHDHGPHPDAPHPSAPLAPHRAAPHPAAPYPAAPRVAVPHAAAPYPAAAYGAEPHPSAAYPAEPHLAAAYPAAPLAPHHPAAPHTPHRAHPAEPHHWSGYRHG
jgi:hypothetical protein